MSACRRTCCSVGALLLMAGQAFGHSAEESIGGNASLEVWVALIPILLAGVWYAMGWRNVLARVTERRLHRMRDGAFYLGLAALAIALLSRVDSLGAELFSVHMIQHEVLMLVAAPLLVAGNPLPFFLWAFPGRARRTIGQWISARPVARSWHLLTRPLAAWLLHAVALWCWHMPSLFGEALEHRWVHDLQHLTFLLTALLFWSALLQAREAPGSGVLYLFTTTIHTSVLGALITLAAHPLYPAYLLTAPAWNLTALEDQQLGGLIMWVPGSLVYVGIGLLLLGRLLSTPSRSARSLATQAPSARKLLLARPER